ncbi:MAG: hypothetical protein R3Y46_05180 [Opitutales bacterium]
MKKSTITDEKLGLSINNSFFLKEIEIEKDNGTNHANEKKEPEEPESPMSTIKGILSLVGFIAFIVYIVYMFLYGGAVNEVKDCDLFSRYGEKRTVGEITNSNERRGIIYSPTWDRESISNGSGSMVVLSYFTYNTLNKLKQTKNENIEEIAAIYTALSLCFRNSGGRYASIIEFKYARESFTEESLKQYHKDCKKLGLTPLNLESYVGRSSNLNELLSVGVLSRFLGRNLIQDAMRYL